MIFQLPRWLRIQVSCLRQVLACFWFLFLFFLSFFLFCRSCRFQVAYSLPRHWHQVKVGSLWMYFCVQS